MKNLTYACDAVVEAKGELEAAQQKFKQTILKAQAECGHGQVLEAPIQRYEYLGGLPAQAIRVCRVCGFSETGGYGAATYYEGARWKATTNNPNTYYDYAEETLLGTDFVLIASRDEVRTFIIKIQE
jgi:hypothetical protein